MLWLIRQNSIQNLAGFFLIGVGFVRRQRTPQECESIKNGGFVILWVTHVKLLHCFLISKRARSVIELVRIFVERLDRFDVVSLPLRSGANKICLVNRSQTI